MIKKWNFCSLTKNQKTQKENLSKELNINPLLAQLLVQRGITTYNEAKHFFRPELTDLHDPFLMKDMQLAVDRLNLALQRKEHILIYGDYDVDGTTAVALVYKFLKQCSSDIDFYVPDRYDEGYGISYKGIDHARDNGFSLVIALDCGIKAVEKMEYAKQNGIDFIICDHHTPDKEIPHAVAVLDPKRDDCNYPYKHLCGCGVGFKFMQAFARSNEMDEEFLMQLLDLVAVSIASDIVPVTGENRVLTYYGLKQLNANPSLGLKTIVEKSGLKEKEIMVSDIVFKIGPRINASGRIDQAKEAVQLLISGDKEEALRLCEKIDQNNQTRKDLDKCITDEALTMMNADEKIKTYRSTVVYNPNWHKGVIGIVASRLSETYYRPTVVLTKGSENNIATGSARSVPGFDIYKAIESCKDLLENFGGHMYAAGLAMKETNVDEFKRRFEKYVKEHIEPEQTYAQINIDAELPFREITSKFFRILKQFNPFGPENMKPVFWTKGIKDNGNSKLVGKNNDHLKMDVKDESCDSVMNGIAFKMGQFYNDLKENGPLDICYTLEENNFNGQSNIQLMIRDIQSSKSN